MSDALVAVGHPAPAPKTFGGYVAKLQAGSKAHWTKDELLEMVFWLRLSVAFSEGIVFGTLPVVGVLGFMLFGLFAVAGVIMLYRWWLGIDEEDYGGVTDFATEGLAPSLACFVLMWTLCYTALHT